MTDIAERLDGCIELSVGFRWPHRCLPLLLHITFVRNDIAALCYLQATACEAMDEKWSSMESHQTSASEIHRKVLRMVSSMSELDARLMLREMNGSSRKK